MTEEQKNCEYCHDFKRPGGHPLHGGLDLSDNELCKFELRFMFDDGYFLKAWGKDSYDGDEFDVESVFIHYCPMCGRKLGKEG